VKGRDRAARGEGRKKRDGLRSVPAAAALAAHAARDSRGYIMPDPRLAKANKRTFFPLEATYQADLFGEPVQPGRDRSGRPRHVPTQATRARVIELRAEGLSQLAIAAALGISGPTLRLNYPVEIGSASRTWRRRVATKPKRRNGAQSRE